MTNLRHYRCGLLLAMLAIVCSAGTLPAQDFVSEGGQPIFVDQRVAARLNLTHPSPDYPVVAKVNYLQGKVQVAITVDSGGKVTAAHALNGDALLAASALQAMTQWTYQPLSTANGPAGFVTTVNVKFNLHFEGMDLSPQQAEKDFLRQLKPARVVRRPDNPPSNLMVHMHLLVNDRGEVVDRDKLPTSKAQYDAACVALRNWTFIPARWGNLPVASYVDVNVPIGPSPVTRADAGLGSH